MRVIIVAFAYLIFRKAFLHLNIKPLKSTRNMKKHLLLIAMILSIGALFSFRAADEHLTGYIGDSTCAASKTDMGAPEARMSCVKKCIKGGAQAVLVVGDKVYKIANQKAVVKYAGKNVTVDAAVNDDTITVSKITEDKPAKS